MGNVHGHAAAAGDTEAVAQLHLPGGRAEVEDPAPAGLGLLFDPSGAERGVRRARDASHAQPFQQPAADAAAGQLQLDALERAGPQLLSHIAPDPVRVRQLAQPHRDPADRQPSGHREERHVQKVLQARVRLPGRQPLEVRLFQRRLRVHDVLGQQDHQTRGR